MDNLLFYLLLGVLVTWVGSYFYSYQYNRRKLRQLALWLKESLSLLGSGQSSRWYGTDRLDINIAEGRGNIRETALVLGVQSRQLFKAVVSLVRGGRDSMSMLVSLRTPPAQENEFEIFEGKGPLPRNVVLAAESDNPWQIVDYPREGAWRLAYRTEAAREIGLRVLTLLLDDGFDPRRISVRSTLPHLLFVLNVGSLPQTDAAPFLRLVKNLAEEISRPPKSTKSRPARSASTLPGTLPGSGLSTRPGLDPGLTQNNQRSTNGHKKHEE